MADNNIVTNITANADFSSLRTQLAAVTAQLVKLQETTVGTNAKLGNQIAVMNKSFADTMRSTGQFSSHFVSLTDDVSKFGKNLDTGRLKLNDYYNTWQGHAKKTSTLVKDLAKQQVMMQQAIVQPLGKNAQGVMQYNVMVAKGIDELKNKTAIARQEAAIMNKVMMDGSNQLINWGKNTQWAGRQLTVGLTVPLVAFGAAASKAFREADAELVRLQKVYGGLAETSSAELAQVRKDVSATAKEIAASYGVAFKDTIALAADLAATGKQGNDLIAATQQTTRLAVLGEVDRQDAMKATLAIQNAFKQSTDELTQSIDFLNAVENQTSTSLADLTEAIPKAGPVVKSLGGDVKDLALYLTAMKEGGVNASEGANAIKSAMASLINPTKVAKETFMGFGIDIDAIVTKNAGNLTETIVGLQSALDTLDPLSKSRAIEQLFGKFQYARMSALFENLGKQGSQTLQVMDLMKASAGDLANISSRELTAMTESASGQYKRALASIQADLAVVGEKFLKIGTYVLKVVDGVIKFFNALPDPIKNLLNFAGGLTAVAGPLIMLTGVLGNFVGYVIKGVFHLRQMLKGGSAFKLLTPEIVAANAAAQGLSTTFYDDTQATIILSNAVNTLTESFANLEIKANAAKVSVQPGINTLANNVLVSAGDPDGRMVDKTSKYVGKPYSRQMSHLVPSGVEQPGTIFGTVPGAGPVNVRVSNNPQPYMSNDMQKIPGLTSINGVGTGIVSQEAAKWHAMTAAIAMQSDAEIKALKAEVTATGTVTAGLSQSYQALLPEFSKITQNASLATAEIVADVQASKINVDQARAKIIALNIQVETLLAQTATSVAGSMGRTVNLTTVPLTGQPTVAPDGKSNMKELFHKGTTKDIVDKIARALGGVRTSGAGYNIETTKPKRLNAGGRVYNPGRDGNIVPGDTSINYDNTPAILQEGGFVLNQGASKINPDLVSVAKNTHNAGGKIVPALLTPGETYFPPEVAETMMPVLEKANRGTRIQLKNTGGVIGGLVQGSKKNYGISFEDSQQLVRYSNYHTDPNFEPYARAAAIANDAEAMSALGLKPADAVKESKKWFDRRWQMTLDANGGVFKQSVFDEVTQKDYKHLQDTLRKDYGVTKPIAKDWRTTSKSGNQKMKKENWRYVQGKIDYKVRNQIFGLLGKTGVADKTVVSRLKEEAKRSVQERAHMTSGKKLAKSGFNYLGQAVLQPWEINQLANSLSDYGVVQNSFSLSSAENKDSFNVIAKNLGYLDHDDMVKSLTKKTSSAAKPPRVFKVENGMTAPMRRMVSSSPKEFMQYMRMPAVARMLTMAGAKAFNDGGEVGGSVKSGKMNYGKTLPQSVMDRLTAKWPAPRQFYQPGFQYKLGNQDPLHGPLQIGMSQNLNRYAGKKDPGFRESIVYRDDRFSRINIMDAFLTGTMEKRGKYATAQYMEGNLDIMSQMERLGNHPLGPIAAMKSVQKKYTGKLFRGLKLDKTFKGLPEDLINAIRIARETGDVSSLIGKEFIMRRSSWSKSPTIASYFAPGSKVNPNTLVIEAAVRNRNILPAGDMFPDKKFMAPHGQDWSGGKLENQYRSEREAIFGGKFRVVGFDKGRLKVETVVDGARKDGGPVNANRPYLVGEDGPELFVPRNSGGIIPGYALGGRVHAGKNNYGALGMLKPMGLSMMGGMGGQTIGRMTGIPGGDMIGMMLGSMLGMSGGSQGQIDPSAKIKMPMGALSRMPKGMEGPSNLTGYGKAITGLVSSGGKLQGVIGKLAMGLTRTNLAFAGAATAVYLLNKRWKDHNEHLRVGVLQYGLTAEAAKKAGLKFTDYNAKIKDTIQNAKELRERNQLIYESLTQADTPIKMTIEQYKKLKKEVKSTYGDQIKLINQTDGSKVNKVAQDLKTQLISAGMSAEEATKKIYAMFKLSNKGTSAISSTVGSAAFTSINDAQTASVAAVSGYGAASKEGGREGAQAVQTGLMSIDTAIQDLIDKSKKAAAADKTGSTQILSSYDAQKKLIDQINASKNTGTKITQETINEMAKQNPEIRKFANAQDTVVSLWQKMDLAAKGFSGNLSELGSKAVDALSKIARVIEEATIASNKSGILKEQYKNLDELTARQKALMKAAKGQSVQQQINARDAIAALQKQIDKTNKLANARKKALEDKRDSENTGRAIEAKRLDLQNKEATGDTAGAQQLRLELESLVKGQQYDQQIKAIDKAAEAENKPRLDKIEALNKAQQKQSDMAALAGDSLSKLNDQIATQRQKIDDVNGAMIAFRVNAAAAGKSLDEYAKTQRGRNELARIENANVAAGNKAGSTASKSDVSYDPTTGLTVKNNPGKTPSQSGLDLVKATQAAVEKGLTANKMDVTNSGDIYINGKKVDPSSKADARPPKKTTLEPGSNMTLSAGAVKSQIKLQGGQKYVGQEFIGKDGVTYRISGDRYGQFQVVKAGFGLMNINPKVPTIVGDRGPEMLFNNMVIPNMGKVPYASPKFDVAKANMQMKDSRDIGGGVYNVTQNIYASDGMDVEALANMVVKQTRLAIGQEAKVNAKMVGGKRI